MSPRPHHVALAALLWLSGFEPYRAQTAPPDPRNETPVESGITEEVEVRFVIVDALVVDGHGRTVPGLTLADFELLLDWKPHTIDTVDLACPAGAADDPQPVLHAADREPAAPPVARKIALVFDYLHMNQIRRYDVLERAQRMLAASPSPGDEILVAAITDDLRIEQPLTHDRERVLETLERMKYDISLWLPRFTHFHENEERFFRMLHDLVVLLGLSPGSKAVVLFSNLPGPTVRPIEPGTSPDAYDLAFEGLSSTATTARVALYPVLADGLQSHRAPKLARLAVETGGRFTEGTNDLSLALARAQRDLGCRYAIGFYDRNPEPGRGRRVTLRVRRPGLRVVHSASYEFQPEERRREARLSAAHLAPQMFYSPDLRVRLFPIRPDGPDHWEALVALSFPVEFEPGATRATLDYGVALRRGYERPRSFDRRIAVMAHGAASPMPLPVTVIDTVRLAAGDYTLSAVVAQAEDAEPHATTSVVQLPPAPQDELFLVGPVLGRVPEGGPAIRRLDPASSSPPAEDDPPLPPAFEPLFEPRVPRGASVVSWTRACRVGGRHRSRGARIERTLRAADGAHVLDLASEPVRLRRESANVWCHVVVDRVSTTDLPAGDYTLEARVASSSSAVVFTVGP